MPEITISVDRETAEVWDAASPQDKPAAQVVIGLWMRRLLVKTGPSLDEIMDQAGRKAENRGLTQEILDSILNEDSPGS
ncbi:MAG: hypothetical protein WA891_11225 [Acidobacteriaceae bacterium]